MKTFEEVLVRAGLETEDWFRRACQNPGVEYSVFYLPSAPEHDGGFSLLHTPPANPEYLKGPSIPMGYSKREVLYWLEKQVLPKLPILSWR